MNKKKLLWIKADPLHPLNSGGKIRTFNMLKHLKEYYDITFFSLTHEGSLIEQNEVIQYSDRQVWTNWKDSKKSKSTFLLAIISNFLFSKIPFVIARYTSSAIKEKLNREISQNNYDCVVCDFLSLSQNILNINDKKETPYILFQHNVESKIWERMVINASNFITRFYLKNQWERYCTYEKNTCSWFDGVISVSKDDTRIFEEEFKLQNIIGDVDTGVDIQYFSKFNWEPKKNSLVFLGSMDWMPNIDGISNFVTNIYPLIKAKIPDVSLTIVGRNPNDKIISYGKKDKSITVTGTVDDIRPYLAQASISIVPLRVGGGTRIKIFETMAANLPVISTSIGAEGQPIENGKNIVLADQDELFAEQTIALLAESERASKIANAGKKFVADNFGWESVTSDFVKMIDTVSYSKEK